MSRLLALRPFAAVPKPGVGVRAAACRQGAMLSLRWVVDGASVLVEGRADTPARRDRLWESTCFEAFLAPAGVPAYWEVNVAAGGDWNVYRFDAHRHGMRAENRAPAPVVRAVAEAPHVLAVAATLQLAPIAELAAGPLDVALAAVLDLGDGERSYWALRHSGAAPDFHARGSFVVRIDGETKT
jgi:hypothetical protein